MSTSVRNCAARPYSVGQLSAGGREAIAAFEASWCGYALPRRQRAAERKLTGSDRSLNVLLIADPGVPAELAEEIADSLPDELSDGVKSPALFNISVRVRPYLADEQAPFREVIESVDPPGLDADIVIYLTDLPRRDDTSPIIADISSKHGFALISVPGVGATFVSRRLREVVALAIGEVIGAPELATGRARRLHSARIDGSVRYFAPRGLRRLRLLAGMVRANRPWRLVTGLSRVLVGAFASGAVGLATFTIWLFSDTMGPWRMGAATILSIGAMVAWLILDHELWERPQSAADRGRSVLYNTATLVTLTIGVAVLYVALFCLLLGAAGVTLAPKLFARTVGHPAGVVDYLELTWLLASIATVGGALGSGLEDDGAVKAAAYGVRQRQRFIDSDSRSGQRQSGVVES